MYLLGHRSNRSVSSIQRRPSDVANHRMVLWSDRNTRCLHECSSYMLNTQNKGLATKLCVHIHAQSCSSRFSDCCCVCFYFFKWVYIFLHTKAFFFSRGVAVIWLFNGELYMSGHRGLINLIPDKYNPIAHMTIIGCSCHWLKQELLKAAALRSKCDVWSQIKVESVLLPAAVFLTKTPHSNCSKKDVVPFDSIIGGFGHAWMNIRFILPFW